MSNTEFALPEDVAREILERASRIDAGNDSRIAIDELRRTAQEAGISGHAFDAAVTQIVNRNQAVPDVQSASMGRAETRSEQKEKPGLLQTGLTSIRLGLITIGTMALGSLSANNYHRADIGKLDGRPEEQVVFVAAMIAVAFLGLAWHDREKHDQRRFQMSSIVGWCTFFLGWYLTRPALPDDLFASILFGLMFTTTIGGLVVGLKLPSWKRERD